MVGTVLISHSRALADALVEYTHVMAPDAPVVSAGGLPDGSFGTSYKRIEAAIDKVATPDGVVVLMDLGSAVLTAKMVVEDMDDVNVRLADCPFVEGAIEATIRAQGGATLDEVMEALEKVGTTPKL